MPYKSTYSTRRRGNEPASRRGEESTLIRWPRIILWFKEPRTTPAPLC